MDIDRVPSAKLAEADWKRARPVVEHVLAARQTPDNAELAATAAAAALAQRVGPALQPGEVVDGRFLLLTADGAGSLVTWWSAHDLHTDTPARLAVLHPQQHAGAGATRFDAMAAVHKAPASTTVAALVAGPARWAGFHYLVLAHVGAPMSESTCEPAQRNARVVELVEALSQLHAAGVAHGALSPSSVRIDAVGAVHLSDMGCVTTGASGAYPPPEAADPTWVPALASDLYSLAMVVMHMHREGDMPYWASRAPERLVAETDLPAPWTDLLGRMVHWDPAERPALAEVLETALGDADHRRALAMAMLESGRPSVAAARLEALLEVDSSDHSARRSLVQALRAAGDGERAAGLLAELVTSGQGDVAADLQALRALADETGEADPWVGAATAVADGDGPHQALATLLLARWNDDRGKPEASRWEGVLDGHRTRAEAREALSRLMAIVEADSAAMETVRWGRELYAYLDQDAERADLAHRLGHLFLDPLDDPDNGVLWLDRSLQAGSDDASLPETLRHLRSVRGEWQELIDLLEEQAGRGVESSRVASLRAAARTAERALGDTDRAGALFTKLLELDASDPEALRFMAHGAMARGETLAAAEALAQITSPTSDDHIHLVDALIAAGRTEDAWRTVRSGLEACPTHALQTRGLQLACAHGDHGDVRALANAVAASAGPGKHQRSALLLLAELSRVEGDLSAADAWVERLLAAGSEDADAWWQRVQIAWASVRVPGQPAWRRALPARFPPHEAVARLMTGLLQPDGVTAWLEEAGRPPAPDSTPLEQAAAVIDTLVAHDALDTLFDALDELAGDQSGWVDSVRRFWDGALNNDEAFPIATAMAWGDQGRAQPRSHRTAVPRTGDRSHCLGATVPDLQPMLQRARVSPLEAGAQAPARAEPTRTSALRVSIPGSPPQQVSLTGPVTLGTGADADVALPEGPQQWCRVELRAGRAYLVSERPVVVNGTEVSECRLVEGQSVRVGDAQVDFIADAQSAQRDELPWLSDEPTLHCDPMSSPADTVRAALFYTHDGSERIAPVVEEGVVIGPGRDADITLGEGTTWLARVLMPEQAAPHGQYTLEVCDEPDAPPVERPLAAGDMFELAGVTFTFQIIRAHTPAAAERSRYGQDDDRVGILVMEDGSLLGRVIPLSEDTFTIGRGRKNDLKLVEDGKLSRHHCTLLRDDDGMRICDNNSSNGTYVDGMPGERAGAARRRTGLGGQHRVRVPMDHPTGSAGRRRLGGAVHGGPHGPRRPVRVDRPHTVGGPHPGHQRRRGPTEAGRSQLRAVRHRRRARRGARHRTGARRHPAGSGREPAPVRPSVPWGRSEADGPAGDGGLVQPRPAPRRRPATPAQRRPRRPGGARRGLGARAPARRPRRHVDAPSVRHAVPRRPARLIPGDTRRHRHLLLMGQEVPMSLGVRRFQACGGELDGTYSGGGLRLTLTGDGRGGYGGTADLQGARAQVTAQPRMGGASWVAFVDGKGVPSVAWCGAPG